MEKQRSSFSGKVGFVLATAGSAVGLGNLWRFPYLAAKYGGAIFLLTYVVLALTFGITLMIAEIAIGRKTGLSAISAYEKLDRRFSFAGKLTAVIPAIILPYYCVIGGWVIKYMWSFITGQGAAMAEVVVASGTEMSFFEAFISNPVQPLIFFAIFLALTGIVVWFGVEKGIEKVSSIMMPLLIVMILGVAIYVMTREGAMAGVAYYLKPDFSNFSIKTVVAAMGQLFYSLSLAMGILITYGSYMKRDVDIETSSFQIAGFDSLIAFLAGLCIIPAVFATGQSSELTAGPSLMFIILPRVFANMPGGMIAGTVFFVLVLFAALTSSISLMEAIVSILQDKINVGRKGAIGIILGICIVLGGLSSLGYGPLASIKIIGMQFLDFFDFFSNSLLMPIVALLTCVLVGWVIKPKSVIDEVENNGRFRIKRMFMIMIKYIAPICLIAIFLSSLLSAFGLFSL